jgi:hypothetical protein
MLGAKRSVVEVSGGPRAFAPKSKTVDSSRCWSGTISCDRSLQKTLVGLAFALVVVGVALV